MSFSSCCLLVSRFSRSRCCCSVSTLISPISASSLEMTEPRFCSSMSCQCLASYKEFSRPLFCKGRAADINQSVFICFIVIFIQVWPICLLNMCKWRYTILRILFIRYFEKCVLLQRLNYFGYKVQIFFTLSSTQQSQ